MGLARYRKKRRFDRTPEPRGRERAAGGAQRRFVVQRHAARHLHYDFRLEHGGVLWSWAVPKGPPAKAGDKRLAVRTEDHPLEYGAFEGTIPKGQYGAGKVAIWDRGRWLPEEEPARGLRAGKLTFALEGERLRGRFSLVRMQGKASARGENWLLLRHANARAERPRRAPLSPSRVPGARKAPQRADLRPQLATLVDVVPSGDDWVHELKYDGYRLLAFKSGRRVRLVTRRGNDWTERFANVAKSIAKLPAKDAVIDGEVVVLAEDGTTSFQSLQNSLDAKRGADHVFFAFDLPHCGGYDLTAAPLVERKKLLARLLAAQPARSPLRYSEHVAGGGAHFLKGACDRGMEGIVSKRANARYETRRTRSWLKVKCTHRQEFVVGGWTSSSARPFGALLLGVHESGNGNGNGHKLAFCGRVGTGFTDRSIEDLLRRMRPLETKAPPFADPPRGAAARGVHWTRPRLVVEVAFSEWTSDGALRHPSFQGIREDKDPDNVVREEPRMQSEQPPRVARVGGVALSHPDRILYPEQGITKRELVAYYASIADHVLPHVLGRPLTLVRCPRGVGEACFFQKHVGESMPSPVRGVRVKEKGGATRMYVLIEDLQGLLTLVQIGTLEFHPWGCRADRLERPDRIVFDLDPGPGVAWADVIASAHRVRKLLQDDGLESFARTTGGKGIHVVAPIERRSTWSQVQKFARAIATRLSRTEKSLYLLTASKAKRKGKIFIDDLRNARGATAIASYSTRARPGAPVATPLSWDELTKDLDPATFTIRTVPKRLAARGDPWQGFDAVRQALKRGVATGSTASG